MQNSTQTLIRIFKAFVFWAVFQLLFFSGGFSFLFPMLPSWGIAIVMGSVIIAGTMLTTWVFLKFDELTWRDLGMLPNRSSWLKLIVSLLVGILFFGSFYVVYYLFTPITIMPVEGKNLLTSFILILLVFLALGTMEEIAFRGYFLKKLASAIGIRSAIYITSIAFGFYHGLSFESVSGPAIWGLYYGVLAYWTKGLAIPIGFHVGVNVIQGIFSEKTKWIEGIWMFDFVDKSSPFTIDQVTIALQLLLLVGGVLLVEYYLRVVQPKQKNLD
ncbi:CPBP family intramembrane glutamic endopeptidase [Glaciecola sp. 1036]|uniref:CPBP family intramembrane glutamic endopeptidase n=1 Tax=Alteromonadaceae TaxID=72275 RepID=UPI003D05EC0C